MEWRRSSRSGSAGNCVELRRDLGAVRDSKRPDAVLEVPQAAVARLVGRVK
ncbi:DUF397 domain-containing protein [Actinokineospora sp. NPDC004072]